MGAFFVSFLLTIDVAFHNSVSIMNKSNSYSVYSPDKLLQMKLNYVETRIKQLQSLLVIPDNPFSRAGGQTVYDAKIANKIEKLQTTRLAIQLIAPEKVRLGTRILS